MPQILQEEYEQGTTEMVLRLNKHLKDLLDGFGDYERRLARIACCSAPLSCMLWPLDPFLRCLVELLNCPLA